MNPQCKRRPWAPLQGEADFAAYGLVTMSITCMVRVAFITSP